MLSTRCFARAIPRASRFISPPVIRRSFSIAAFQNSPLRQPWRPAFQPIASYSTSPENAESFSTVNEELAMKLNLELNIENEMGKEYPDDVQEYLDNTSFKLHDTPGQEEVVLTRRFGDESIRVVFSIADLDQAGQDQEEQTEDDAMMDELEDPSDNPSDIQSGGRSRGAASDEAGAADVTEDGAEDSMADQQSFPATVEVTVERPNKGAIQIVAIAQDGFFVIDTVSYFKEGGLARSASPEDEFKSRDLYAGPQFANLDEDLQVLFERYLDERGIDVGMATFVPNFIEWKEQSEYTRWLENVKQFME